MLDNTPTTRAKFVCDSVQMFTSNANVALSPVRGTYGGPETENDRFYALTPGGSLVLQAIRAEVAANFTPGQEYYIDITPVPANAL